MTTEMILGGIIVVTLIGHFFYVRESNKEKSKLLNAIIARNGQEMRDLELTDKVAPIKPEVPQEPQFIPEAELSDEEFEEKVIGKEIG